MRERKWQVTAAIVALMIIGAFAAAAIARRGADDDARRASDTVQRWFLHHGGGQVRSCEATAESSPQAPVYPVANEQIDDHGVAAPLGPAQPKRC
jgi:hypothetical protein